MLLFMTRFGKKPSSGNSNLCVIYILNLKNTISEYILNKMIAVLH